MKLSLDDFLDIAEHFYKVYIKFYDLAEIKVPEENYYKEINDIISQMLHFTYECNEDFNDCNLDNFGRYAVVELIQKDKEYNFCSGNLGLYFKE